MRIRSIKPEFFKHDVLGSLSPLHRILFIGLWCMADCAGRMEDRPKRIKVEVLPYDDADVDEMLSNLKSSGLLTRYEVGEQRLIEISAFLRHQRITGKEADTSSRFPSASPTKTKKRVGKQQGNNGETPETTGDGRETEGKGDDSFLLFWTAYPKKKSKEQAERAFEKITEPLSVLIPAITRARASADWRKDGGKYIPYPATWLNQRRWEDSDDVEVFAEAPRPPVAYDAPSEI